MKINRPTEAQKAWTLSSISPGDVFTVGPNMDDDVYMLTYSQLEQQDPKSGVVVNLKTGQRRHFGWSMPITPYHDSVVTLK